MKNFYVHGTTKENLEKIREEGFSNTRYTTWNCSDSNYIYLRKLDFNEEAEDIDEGYFESIRLCLENAQITAALNQSFNTGLAIIFFEIDDNYIDINEDGSCENMYNCYEISVEDANNLEYSVIEFENLYDPGLRYFHLPIENDYFDLYNAENLNMNIVKEIKRIDYCSIYDEQYEQINEAIDKNQFQILEICKRTNLLDA